MPIIRYKCECGESVGKYHRSGASAPVSFVCACGKDMKRTMMGPSQNSKIAVDNGAQARKIEISVDEIKDGQNKARFIEKQRNKP